MDFTGRAAIVTGAGKGVGRAIVEALASRGAAVVVNNRDRDGTDPAGRVAAGINEAGGVAVAERSPVEAPGAADTLVATALDNFGRLDLVVANAAIVDRATFATCDLARFRQVIEIDFMAPVMLAKAALPHVGERSGRMVFVTSAAGAYGEYGVASYAAAKGALGGFARTLALESAREGVRINLLAPFAVTQMTERFVDDAQARLLDPAFVVPAALWLLSDQVDVSGATIVAAANRFRRVVTGETEGVSFPPTEPVTDDDYLAVAERVLSLEGWRPHGDGFAAFTDLMRSIQEPEDGSG